MVARHLEELSLVPDLVDHLGVGEDPPLAVAHDCSFLPATLEQLVGDLHVLLGHLVAVVVPAQAALAYVLGPALEVGSDDVPTDAAAGVVVGGGEPAGEGVRVLERGRRREADPQVLGSQRDRGDQLQRIVDRDLRRFAQRVEIVALVDVVVADHVGDEDPVEDAPF